MTLSRTKQTQHEQHRKSDQNQRGTANEVEHENRHLFCCKRNLSCVHALCRRYSVEDAVEGKAVCKEHLRREFNLSNADVPLVAVVTRLTPQKGIHLIKHAAWRTLERGGQFVLLGSAPDPRVQVGCSIPSLPSYIPPFFYTPLSFSSFLLVHLWSGRSWGWGVGKLLLLGNARRMAERGLGKGQQCNCDVQIVV